MSCHYITREQAYSGNEIGDEAHASKFSGRTLKRMSGMCKKEDRKGDAKTSV
jgi:hypothetical protein